MPTAKRFFLPEIYCVNAEVPPATTWHIDDEETVKHLVQVQRLKPGQPVIAVDSTHQQAYACAVAEVKKASFTLGDISLLPQQPEHAFPQVTLYIGLLKEQAWDVVLQKACELGVHRIVPLWADYSTLSHKQVNEAKLQRWQRILKEAALQCEGFTWPTLHSPFTVTEALAQQTVEEAGVVLMERHPNLPSLIQALGTIDAQVSSTFKPLGLWVGPEGGWSPEEMSLLKQSLQPASLGQRILRAETACIAGLSLLIHGRD